MEKRWLSLIFLIGALWMTQAFAGIYKWTDADGNIHFGEQPPADVKSDSVTVQSTPAPDSDVGHQHRQQTNSWANSLEKDQQARRQAEQKDEETRRRNEALCKAAKSRLYGYEQGGVFYHIDDTGKRTYLSDKEVDARRAELQQAVNQYCGS